MSGFSLLALLLSVTAVFAYINHRLIRLPPAVGMMGLALVSSLALIGAGELGLPLRGWASAAVANVDFGETLLQGMLSFMLFAGALHVDLKELRDQKVAVGILATVGVLISTMLVGGASYLLFHLLGLDIKLIVCFVFGALISPTDPIAVIALLKESKAPLSLMTKIAGESLFNDGVGIVVFVTLFRVMQSGPHQIGWEETSILLLRQVAGGLTLGLVLGGLCFLLLRSVDNYQVEMLVTLGFVSGGYELAAALGTSGPLAVVVAGLLIGNYGRDLAMSNRTRKNLDNFWELLDEILNGVLFVLIGLEVLVLELRPTYVLAASLMVPLVLTARAVSLALPSVVMRWLTAGGFPVILLSWGGLRGGISIALALSLPGGHERDVLLVATYGVVAFSILVQATTMPWFLRKGLDKRYAA